MSLHLTAARLNHLFREFHGRPIAVIGDIMLDRYLHGSVKRISPEAPIPILHVEREHARPGGAANVAWNLARLGARCTLVGLCGRDANAALLKGTLREFGVETTGIVAAADRPTVVKTRIVSRQQQLLRIDREAPADAPPTSAATETRLIAAARRALQKAQAVIFSDYVKGCLTPRVVREILALAARRRIPVLVDSKDNHVEHYRGADWIKPNRHEAARVVGFELHSDRDYERAGELFFRRTGCRVVAITRGAQGMSFFTRAGRGVKRLYGPNHALEVADVTGAGDTAMAIMALMAAVQATATPGTPATPATPAT
ncbi:MAG: bifunctional heptose 7-phosphate kinase/heptose 1-phosphate adenyltransferase, partial [Planctomycetota bacterium]